MIGCLVKKQERDREPPGDVMVLFGQEASKRVAPGDVMVLFGEKREKTESPGCG